METHEGPLSEQIKLLPNLNKTQLLSLWVENFNTDPPPTLRKELMVPILAYRMQEREFGGLSHRARRQREQVAKASIGMRHKSSEAAQASFLRMWRGEMHEVTASDDGYRYRGECYASADRWTYFTQINLMVMVISLIAIWTWLSSFRRNRFRVRTDIVLFLPRS
jgi:hypothetical protein